jgi:predicted metal-dependent hydrolase
MRARRAIRPEASDLMLEVGDTRVRLEVKRHPAARRLTMRVSHIRHAVVVTMPMRSSVAEAERFVDRHLDWVREKLGRIPPRRPFESGMQLPLRGDPHEVVFTATADGRGRVVREARLGRRPRIVVTGALEHCARRLRDWLIEEARRDLDARVAAHAARLKVRPRRMTIRDQTSRWGSCSSKGTLSFSWRLVLAPSGVLDYLAAHEVAHLAEMNHGPRFWKLVERTCPDMERHRNWLRAKGAELHSYGAHSEGNAAPDADVASPAARRLGQNVVALPMPVVRIEPAGKASKTRRR